MTVADVPPSVAEAPNRDQKRSFGQAVRAFGARLEAFVTRPFNIGGGGGGASVTGGGALPMSGMGRATRVSLTVPSRNASSLRIPEGESSSDEEDDELGFAVDPMTALRGGAPGQPHRATTGCIRPPREEAMAGGIGGDGGGAGSGVSTRVASSIVRPRKDPSYSFSATNHHSILAAGNGGNGYGGGGDSVLRSAASESNQVAQQMGGSGGGLILPPILLPQNFHLRRPDSRLSYRCVWYGYSRLSLGVQVKRQPFL